MEQQTINKVTGSSLAVLTILAIVMGANLLGQENVYACEISQIAMKCDKLSSINADGLQTRCYFHSEELNRTSYKSCKTGWLPYLPEKVIEKDLNLTKLKHVYLLCEKNNDLVSMCQVVDQNETIYQVGGTQWATA